jgi:hypothetical protein
MLVPWLSFHNIARFPIILTQVCRLWRYCPFYKIPTLASCNLRIRTPEMICGRSWDILFGESFIVHTVIGFWLSRHVHFILSMYQCEVCDRIELRT